MHAIAIKLKTVSVAHAACEAWLRRVRLSQQTVAARSSRVLLWMQSQLLYTRHWQHLSCLRHGNVLVNVKRQSPMPVNSTDNTCWATALCHTFVLSGGLIAYDMQLCLAVACSHCIPFYEAGTLASLLNLAWHLAASSRVLLSSQSTTKTVRALVNKCVRVFQ